MKVIIIGGVAAGLSTAAKLKRENSEIEVVVYAKGKYISYGSCGLPYYITDIIKEHGQLISKNPEKLKEQYGIKVHTLHEVVKVMPNRKKIIVRNLSDLSEYEETYDELVVATGASSSLPNVKGLNQENCYLLRDLEDGIKLKEKILDPKVKRVIVIGSGYIGLEVVEVLKAFGKDVVLINRSDRLMKTYDHEVSTKIRELLIENQVELHLGENLLEVDKQLVKTDVGEYHGDIVIAGLGNSPNTNFLADTGIDLMRNGAIIVNSQMKTNISNIYAAGDCASVNHMLKNKPAYIPLATNASKQGKIVAQVIAGKNIKMQPVLGSNAIMIFDYHFAMTGLNEKEALEEGFNVKTKFVTTNTKPSYYPGSENIMIKLIYEADTKVLLGAQSFGKADVVLRIDVFSACIFNKMTTSQIEYLDLCYAPPFSGVWDAVNISAGTIK